MAVNYTPRKGRSRAGADVEPDAKVNRGRRFSVALAELGKDSGGAPVLVLDASREPLRADRPGDDSAGAADRP